MPTAEEVARGKAKSGAGGGGKRGTVNNKRRLDAFAERRGKGSADWGSCSPEWVLAVVVAVTGLGGAVTFGLSRDEGAHSMTLLLDGERQSLWFNGDANLDVELEQVCAVLDAMT